MTEGCGSLTRTVRLLGATRLVELYWTDALRR